MIGDRELAEFRQGYYRLLGTLFAREPTPEFLRSLAKALRERVEASRNLNPRLGEGWKDVAACLEAGTSAQEATEEFTALFIGPRPALHPYESYYLAGKFYDTPLAAVREFIQRVGIAREPTASDPDDAIAFECEVMARLIGRQVKALDPDGEAKSAHLQGEFLKHHLLVWAPKFAEDLLRKPRASLYRGVAKILGGFLELEREVIAPWGPEGFRSYEEARRAVTGRAEWRGPVFELPGSGEEPRSAGGEAQHEQ